MSDESFTVPPHDRRFFTLLGVMIAVTLLCYVFA